MKEKKKEIKQNLILRLLTGETITRDKFVDDYGISDSLGRKIMQEIADRYPVISFSIAKGYRLALNDDDIEDVAHALNELDSRIFELENRKQKLLKFAANYDIFKLRKTEDLKK